MKDISKIVNYELTECPIVKESEQFNMFIVDIHIPEFIECKYACDNYCKYAINFGCNKFCHRICKETAASSN